MPFRSLIKRLALLMLTAASLAVLCLIGLLWWMKVADDSVVTVVNLTGAPLTGVVRASEAFPLDEMAPGRRRRIVHHPVGELAHVFEWSSAPGKTVEAESPYHDHLFEVAEDGPDDESIVLVEPGSLRVFDVDHMPVGAETARIRRLAGYELDRRVPSPSGALEAVIRVGPSLNSNRSWRVVVVSRGASVGSGATVIEATDAAGLRVAWSSDRALKVNAPHARVQWLHRWSPMFLEIGGIVQTTFDRAGRAPAD
jgi:hypothetical protein